ncbi:DUF3307 domain-containing protein [Streptomyces sp. NPDC079167]|uniref:DUF3307 domain-containing protein n=1 Tax=Streptomyces sp. NPDC079167 TaxID=3154513 RepID=UPI003414183A
MFASLFVLLYVAHLLADYPLQTDHQAAHKASGGWAGWSANAHHAATHIVTCGAALLAGAALLDDVDISMPVAVGALVWIGATHAVIDRRWPVQWWMHHTGQSQWAQHGGAAHVDQAAHVAALLVAALALSA